MIFIMRSIDARLNAKLNEIHHKTKSGSMQMFAQSKYLTANNWKMESMTERHH